MSLITGVVILVLLRTADLNHSNEHTPRYGLRLGLGILLLLAALVIARRKPKPPDPDKPGVGNREQTGRQPGAVDRVRGLAL